MIVSLPATRMSHIGIGIFGIGEVTKVLAPLLREKGFNLVAIWGPNLKETEELSKSINVPFYTNKIDDVLLRKDVDLIFILCPPYLHSQISVKALGKGFGTRFSFHKLI